MNEVFNHLWQSTAFAIAVAAATLLLRRNSPRLRYWLWLAASAKFLVPFSLLVATGARVQLPPDTPSLHATTVQQVSAYFAPVTLAPSHAAFPWSRLLAAVWLIGAIFLSVRWFLRWRKIHIAARTAAPLLLDRALPAYASSAMLEPGVFGIFRPVLLLPEGLADHLTPEQFKAVLAHESRHFRYRDNLTAALHMLVETLFWFHPLVWWIGAKLLEERERDCDEAVLTLGSQPSDYARGIVSVCQSYVESPLPCASGISGADLKKRIREIMTWRGSRPVTPRAKAMLAVTALAAVSIPFVLGVIRAQTLPPAPAYTYDTVSIHKSASATQGWGWRTGPQGGLRISNSTVMDLLTLAYQVQDYQLAGLPKWASSDRYDIVLTPAEPEAPETDSVNTKEIAHRNRNWQRLQAVLRDRFGLVLRAETHELPVYSLTQAKKAIQLSRADGQRSSFLGNGPGRIIATAQRISRLAIFLSAELGRPVIDETGLTGQYDFQLTWTPDPGLASTGGPPKGAATLPATGPSLFTALSDQLGLRLESKKGPVTVYVVEKIDHPTEN